jgi:hypothetical protein
VTQGMAGGLTGGAPPEARRVWYVAYGSNLASRRFRCYLQGGLPDGGRRRYVGCRDPSDPARVVSLDAPGGLVFAGSSGMWGGGMAFYDPDAHGRVACRAYLVTVEQFADVVAQEMRRPPGGEFTTALVSALPRVETVHVMGPGRYETIARLGVRDGAPLLTVTAADIDGLDLAPPSERYLRWIADGLEEAHGWTPERIAAYLSAAPGARGAWTRQDVAALAAAGPR